MTIDEQKVHGHGLFVHQAVRVVDYNKSFNNILVRGPSAFGAKKPDGKDFVLADLIRAITEDVNFNSTGSISPANSIGPGVSDHGFR